MRRLGWESGNQKYVKGKRIEPVLMLILAQALPFEKKNVEWTIQYLYGNLRSAVL